MSDELRARATWLPPWGSCHGGAVTERAVPVRGIDCAETYLPWNAPLHAVFVPVRGAGRISHDSRRKVLFLHVSVPARGIGCVHHLRGYQAQLDVSVPVRGIDCILQPLRQPLRHRVFVPVRGMSCVRADVLQPPTGQVTVPVRGIDCISLIVRQKSSHRVSVPVRGIDCIGKTAQRSASRWDDYSTCCPALQGVRARRPGGR